MTETTDISQNKKSNKKWLWLIPPVVIISGYLIYEYVLPGSVDIVVDIQ